jgi:BirA family biotin operon repressor/biotin-[acetyl-CoA-carboxylase] ligase
MKSERLNSSEIRKYLELEAGDIHVFDSLDSTNSWLLKNGQCGDVCLSEQQTAGKGRRGNSWVSPDAGNIYFSMCWCFEEMTEYWSLLGLVVGVAVAETLNEIGLSKHGIKWPNDIFWNDRKLGGILLESQDQSGRVVIGVGLNIGLGSNMQITEEITQPWISLRDAMGNNGDISRNLIVAKLINNLRKRLLGFSGFNFSEFSKDWQKWDILSERQVYFQQQNERITGKVRGIDKYGRIAIVKQDGMTDFYSSVDVKLLRL